MERKELGSGNRELWRGSNSDSRDNKVTGHNSAATTGVLNIPDHWEGYECLLSDDLFTVLALDVWRYEEYDDELVNQHYEEISRFLNNLIRLRDGGISFQDNYPKLNIELAKVKTKEAFLRLDSSKKRKEYFTEFLEQQKHFGRERLEIVIKTIVADNKVSVEESLQFIEVAKSLHFTEAEAAGILLEEILKQGFKPCKPLNQNLSNHSKLLSTEFEGVSNISPKNQQTPATTITQSSSLLSVEDLLGSGIIEEYLQGGGKTEGREWLEFYKSLKADFQIGSISELKSLIDVNKQPFIESKLVEMIEVEGGTFLMGATPEQGEKAHDDEKPVHNVTLSSFLIGKYPLTQKLWDTVMGSNNSFFKKSNRPVGQVSWYDAVEFCNKLSKLEGLDPVYKINKDVTDPNNENDTEIDELRWLIGVNFKVNGYRLPTEAEWEYASRGGKRSREYKYSGSDDIDDVAWYTRNSGQQIKEVGKKQPNELGIYDMSGNVWEWCWDWYGQYSSSPQQDPNGPISGSERVLRGASGYINSGNCRVASRHGENPAHRDDDIGFRLVRTK